MDDGTGSVGVACSLTLNTTEYIHVCTKRIVRVVNAAQWQLLVNEINTI